MSEYIVSNIDALGDASDKYIDANSDNDAIEEGKMSLDEDLRWQRSTSDRTTRVCVVVSTIDGDGITDQIWNETRYIQPRLPKCYDPFHRFVRRHEGDVIIDVCTECDVERRIDSHDDEYDSPIITYASRNQRQNEARRASGNLY